METTSSSFIPSEVDDNEDDNKSLVFEPEESPLEINNFTERNDESEENQELDEEIEDIEEDDDDDDDEDEEENEGAVGGTVLESCIPSAFASTLNIQSSIPNLDTTNRIDDSLRSILGDMEIPDGVDPSFLAALPDEMRAEVISEHLRLHTQRQRTQPVNPPQSFQVDAVAEVNPEFLAALPPNIQEEVLAQQRIEIQRQAAQSVNPNEPVNAAEFFQNLAPNLRQAVIKCIILKIKMIYCSNFQILSDIEESQISVLPPDLAEEAQTLRRDWESRNRQMMQERLLHQINESSNFPSVLRFRRKLLIRKEKIEII